MAVCVQSNSSTWVRVVALVAGVLVARPAPLHSEPPARANIEEENGADDASEADLTQSSATIAIPTEWLPARGRECVRKAKRATFCQGPRKVPLPRGEEAELATRLGLGTRETASDLIVDPPRPEWIEAAGPTFEEELRWPVDEGTVWRGLQRARRSKRGVRPSHRGIDIGAPEGALIRAVKSGVVAYSDNGVRGYGNLLMAIHPDGSVAMYGHCRAIYVFAGQRIVQGQIVGEVGHTGVARGSHLHFEYREQGKLRDPLIRFSSRPES